MAQENTSTENIAQYWDDAIQGRLTLYQHLSPHDPPDVQSSAHQRITAEISALRRGISSLNSRLNALTPVALLPPEILAECFEILACIDQPPYPESHLSRAQQRHLGWITVTHVSSRWREVALNRPSLWATLSFQLGPTWISSMLSRARDTPLVIHHDFPSHSLIAASEARCMINVLRCNLGRARTVTIGGMIPSSVASSDFKEALTTSSAVLESITILLSSSDEDEFISDNFLGNYAPCLRKVDFVFSTSHCLYWTRPVFKGLTHMSIELVSDPPLQDYAHFFDMIDQNPLLQSIELVNALPQVANPLQHQRRVMLSHLQSFAFYGSPSSCAELLHTFEVPLKVKLKLSIDSTIDTQPESKLKGDYSALCQTLKSMNESHQKSPFRTLVFHDFGRPRPDDDVCIKTYRSAGWVPGQSQFASFDDTPSLSLYVVPAIAGRPGHGASACRMLPSLPFKDIDTFILVDALGIPHSWCDPLSMGLPNIKYFQLNGINLEQAFPLLCLPFSSSELDSTNMPATFTVFPRLTHLRLHGEHLEEPSRALQDGLLAMLNLRRNHGAPLKWLGLKGFHLSPKALDGLRALVPVVVMDKE